MKREFSTPWQLRGLYGKNMLYMAVIGSLWRLLEGCHMMHHAVPWGTALCGATLHPPEVKSCRIIWCVVQREHIVENHCDLLGFQVLPKTSKYAIFTQ